MRFDENLKYNVDPAKRELENAEYFNQFSDVISVRFKSNEEITLYRTCQSLPCSEDDKKGRRFRKANSPNPAKFNFSLDELAAMPDEVKYSNVTDAALSFNDSEDAAIKSAISEYAKRKSVRQKSSFIKKRGEWIGKFAFPPNTVLISEMWNNHCNILTYTDVDIEEFRDKDFTKKIDYEDWEGD